MDGKNNIPVSVIESALKEIAYHEQKIKDLKFALKILKENPPKRTEFIPINVQLTRDLLRKVFSNIDTSLRTVEIIDMLYHNIKPDKRSKLIKTASVMLNQMEKEGELTVERQSGIKGNYYKLKK